MGLATRRQPYELLCGYMGSLGIPYVHHGSEIVPDRAHVAGAPIVLIA